MGSGASNQVRSRPEITTKVENFEKFNSPSLSDHHGTNLIKTPAPTKEDMLVASKRSVVSSQR